MSSIPEFYRGETIFVTGATGFLGKGLIEKLLRSCPEVDKILILIRNKKGKSGRERLDELLMSQVFDRIRQENPEQLKKFIALEGELEKPEFEINQHDKQLLYEETSVVFHLAASVKVNEKIRKSATTNLIAMKYVTDACKLMKNLKAFVHVSTAYSNCDRKEIEEKIYDSPLNIEGFLETLRNNDDRTLEELTPSLLCGRPNTYTLTKALAESLVARECVGMPAAIVRPSFIISSWKEPFPGWIDNYQGTTTLFIAVSLGAMQSVLADPKVAFDLIPVDIVVNFLITVAWKTATEGSKELSVYNCCSGSVNKVLLGDIGEVAIRHALRYPSDKILQYPNCSLDKSRITHTIKSLAYHYYPAIIYDVMALLSGKKVRYVRTVRLMHTTLQLAELAFHRDWTFGTRLMQCTTPGEKDFSFDIRDLNWQEYLWTNMSGIRKYILREDIHVLPEKTLLRRLYVKQQVLKLSIFVLGCFFLWIIWKIVLIIFPVK